METIEAYKSLIVNLGTLGFKKVTHVNHVDIKALETAVDALKKQIPAKPNGIMENWERSIDKVGYCPNCNKSVFRIDNYCSACGQALDWR